MRHQEAAWYTTSDIYAGREIAPEAGARRAFRPDWRHKVASTVLTRPGHSLLDVGCGDGGFVEWARRRRCDAYGSDMDPRAVALTGQRIRPGSVAAASAEACATDRTGPHFDVICLFEVLKHVVESIAVLRGLAQRLLPLLRTQRGLPRALLAEASLCLAPAVSAMLRAVRPDAGGFALRAIASPEER
jgi:SAM-dependent methyltransferase